MLTKDQAGSRTLFYDFEVSSYQILKPRSLHKDTNYIAVALEVNGHMVGTPQSKFMGNQGPGKYHVGIRFPNVKVEGNSIVTMKYHFINKGHADDGTAVIESILRSTFSSAGGLLNIAFANCDGPITPAEGRRLEWNMVDLSVVAPGRPFVDKQNEPGSDSPHGCGDNSHYIVEYTVSASA